MYAPTTLDRAATAPNASAPGGPAPAIDGRRLTSAEDIGWLPAARLGLLATHAASRESGYRSLRVTAVVLALSGTASVLLLARIGAAAASDVIALRILAYASWIFGAFGLSVLLKTGTGDAPALARLRGFDSVPLRARALGLALRLAFVVALGALPVVIAALVAAPTNSVLLWRVALLGGSLVYIALLSTVLALVGVAAERLRPESPRFTAALFVLVPFGIALLGPHVPSIPGAFAWGLSQMLRWGAFAS